MALRRWFRFSLRTLLIVATLLCLVLAFLVMPARKHRQAVLELKRRGAQVWYEREWSAKQVVLPPPWTQTWLGCDFGERVDYINFYRPNTTALSESDWRLIETCQPKELSLGAKEQGDRDLARAVRLPGLKALALFNPSLTDQGLLPLKKESQIQGLNITTPLLTNVGVAHLATVSGLKDLRMDDPPGVTSPGIAKLQRALPQCTIHWKGVVVPDWNGIVVPVPPLGPMPEVILVD